MSTLRDECIVDLQRWLRALSKWTSPAGARIAVGPPRARYARVWDELQGFARPLWGMAPLAASGQAHRLGEDVWERWRKGLIAGTDPKHPEFWGPTHDHCQAFCEMPPIALALIWAGERMWAPLLPAQQELVVRWLSQINDSALPRNNWLLFRILVNLALARLVIGGDQAQVLRDLEDLDDLYEGNGWYVDGRFSEWRSADGYVASAFHVYGLIVAELLQARMPEHAERLRARAQCFALDWRWFTDARGAMLPWGRSLAYRWTPAAFWSACAWADLPLLPWEQIAACWRSQRRWWQTQRIEDPDGLLTMGFTYEHEAIGEDYLTRSSLFWLCKNALALRQTDEHPFWSGPEQRPSDRPSVLSLPQCGGLLAGNSEQPLLLLVGQQGPPWIADSAARYRRFAYDTRHGFQIPLANSEATPDNQLLLREPGGPWRGRGGLESWRVEGEEAFLKWMPLPGCAVETRLRPTSTGYLRWHRICTNRPLDVLEGGFAVPPGAHRIEGRKAEVLGEHDYSAIEARDERRASIELSPSGINLLHPRVHLPVLAGSLSAGTHELCSETWNLESG